MGEAGGPAGWGPRAAVALFGRAPGEGKTRLRRGGVGAEGAARLYAAAARGGALAAARGLPGARAAFLCAGADQGPCEAWLRAEGLLGGGGGGAGAGGAGRLALARQDQSSPSLGARMAAAFEAEFARGADRVLVVGTDVPSVSAGALADALVALQRFDLALGPAHDGGYYLVGLAARAARGRCARLFAGVDWSTPEVLEQQLANARLLGLRAAPVEGPRAPLPPLIDVDTPEDLRLWLQQPDSKERNPEFFREAVATLWRLDRSAAEGGGAVARAGSPPPPGRGGARGAGPEGGAAAGAPPPAPRGPGGVAAGGRSPLPRLVASWLGPPVGGTGGAPAPAVAAAPARSPSSPPALSPTPYGVRPL